MSRVEIFSSIDFHGAGIHCSLREDDNRCTAFICLLNLMMDFLFGTVCSHISEVKFHSMHPGAPNPFIEAVANLVTRLWVLSLARVNPSHSKKNGERPTRGGRTVGCRVFGLILVSFPLGRHSFKCLAKQTWVLKNQPYASLQPFVRV